MRDRSASARVARADCPPPGRIRMVDVGGHRVGLFQVAGRFYALADRCPHRGAPLCSSGEVATTIEVGEDGGLRTGPALAIVRCPWHKWDFDIASGRCLVDERLRVRRYDVRSEPDGVVITLAHARGGAA